MIEKTELLTGVYLSSLDTGSAVDLETKSRLYRLEHLEGDRIRISGHPQWCPTPVLARLHGSRVGSGEFEEGYIGCGMCRCLNDWIIIFRSLLRKSRTFGWSTHSKDVRGTLGGAGVYRIPAVRSEHRQISYWGDLMNRGLKFAELRL
jgi:hypothetical protein